MTENRDRVIYKGIPWEEQSNKDLFLRVMACHMMETSFESKRDSGWINWANILAGCAFGALLGIVVGFAQY